MIRRALHTSAALSLLLVAAAAPPIDALEQLEDLLPEATEPGFFELSSWAAAARRAMEAEQYDEAITQYRKLREARPDLPAVPYNEAVAHYLNGDLDTASQLFSEVMAASEDNEFSTRAAHNLLSATHRRAQPAIEQLSQQQQQQQQSPSAPPAGGSAPPTALDPETLNRILEETPHYLDEAMEQFARSLDVDPDDLDARIDGERAQGLMTQLRELMQQQPQQGDEQQDQDEQNDEEQQEQQQDQQQEQSEGDDEQEQQQQQQGESDDQQEEQQDQQEQGQEQEQEQEQEQQQQQQQEQQQQEQQEQQQQEQQATAGEEEQDRPMTPEEARRLLQQVRDKEQRRREELARRERARHEPAEKDW